MHPKYAKIKTSIYTYIIPNAHFIDFNADFFTGRRGGVRNLRRVLRAGPAPRETLRQDPPFRAEVPSGAGSSRLPQFVHGDRGREDEIGADQRKIGTP